jgi:TPP-dependent pyruvate/acetoin dehydrogenase alpha subunit/pyruvate/2-oxoglutarate/acetoin dehydrogenase E1 component
MPETTPRELYRTMLRIRAFEERVLALFGHGELRGTTHVCLGQEAVAAGACAALGEEDYVTSTHRGHGHMIARGASMERMMAELFGRAAGYSRGAGGSQHMAAAEVGFLGSNGITGGGLPLAAGAGLSQQLRKTRGIVLAFLGDGASAQGTFHESVNLATIWRLPVVYLAENNQYAMGTPVSATCPDGDVARRAAGYGIPGVRVDGNDPVAVCEAVEAARERALREEGPTLIEAVTYRATGHSRSDRREYVPDGEAEAWAGRDPLARLRTALLEELTDPQPLEAMARDAEAEVEAAVDRARGGEPLGAGAYLHSPEAGTHEPPALESSPSAEECTYAEAIYKALARALSDRSVVFLGEDVADYGGAFKVSGDLFCCVGSERVRNTPISENTLVGCGLGAAMTGCRAVVEIMFMDFLLLAMDQLVNHAAKFGRIYGGQFALPLTVRTPAGGYRGYGATHSQCFEGLLAGVPDLRVYTPATVQDAYDLLLEAIYRDEPVVVVEHKLLYGTRGRLDPRAGGLAPGTARIAREGGDLTIVTFGGMLPLALTAADRLAEGGVRAEVVDLRTLAPLDVETMAASAAKTQRVILLEEGHRTGGVGAELAATLGEATFGYLDAPVLRVAARDVPVPAAEHLEREVLPQLGHLLDAARRLLTGEF